MSNRLRLLAVTLLVLLFVPAAAMQQSDLPPRFNIPWGNSSVAPYIRNIPQASQIGIQNCSASLTDGFPPLTFVPASAGGCPPFGADFNGVLKQITQWSRWQAAGGPVFYDATLSTAIGGYPKGATVQSSVLIGRIWFSTADNNTTNPDSTSAANWTVLPGTNTPGQPVPSFSTTPPPNTVAANGTTIGNASSNATARANADTFWLFSFIWNNCINLECPLFNSSGGAISRGGSASADYAANDAIAVYNMNGSGLIGADQNGSTLLNGAPIIYGSTTTPGSVIGQNNTTLSIANLPVVTPAGTIVNGAISITQDAQKLNTNGTTPGGGAGTIPLSQGATISASQGTSFFVGQAFGSGTAHNIISRSFVTYWNLAL